MIAWTPERVAVLRARYADEGNDTIAAALGCSSSALYTKASDLGLRKSEAFRKSYLSVNRVAAVAAISGRPSWNSRPRIEKACVICGASFLVTQARRNAPCCSVKCGNKKKSLRRGEGHPLRKARNAACAWCGAPLVNKPCKQRMCSKACSGAYSVSLQDGRRSSIELAVEAVLVEIGEAFIPQKKMARWSVDFYLPARKLVIECDGDYWHGKPHQIEKDRRKDGWLVAHGLRIKRLTETAINANAKAAVLAALEK